MAVSAESNAIITTSVVKDYLAIGVTAADTTLDDFIQTWINYISSEMEGIGGINNKIVSQVVAQEIRNGNGRARIRPNYYPLVAIGPYTSASLSQTTSAIVRASGSFITDGWEVGMTGTITDAGSNNGATFTVTVAAALSLTVSETLVVQSAIASVLTPSTLSKLKSIQVRDDVDSAWEDIETDLDHIILNNPDLSLLSQQNSYNIELTEETFAEGTQNIKLTYRAGWSTIPADLTIVCLEKVVDVVKQSARRGDRFGLNSLSKSEGGGTRNTQFKDFTERHQKMMKPYKRRI